jgi:DNA-binding transcriptional MocR family regulator
LRKQVSRYLMHSRGIHAPPERVLIVNGFQQAVTLTARVLVNEGDSVAVEDPAYFLARQALLAHGANVLSVPTDANGLVCADLPEHAPRFIHVTPSHQYPTGTVLSLQRRRELLCYAQTKRCWILEDDYDGDFRYESKPLPALQSLDHADRVIYAGTFSKIMFSSMRLGYMVLPVSLFDDFVNAKFLCDFSTSAIEQAALAHFMETGGFSRHLLRASKTLKARREELVEGLASMPARGCRWRTRTLACIWWRGCGTTAMPRRTGSSPSRKRAGWGCIPSRRTTRRRRPPLACCLDMAACRRPICAAPCDCLANASMPSTRCRKSAETLSWHKEGVVPAQFLELRAGTVPGDYSL